MSEWKENAIRFKKYRRGGFDLRSTTSHARRPRPFQLQYKITKEPSWFHLSPSRKWRRVWRVWNRYHDLEGIRQAFPKMLRNHPSYLWRIDFEGRVEIITSLEDI